MVADGPRGGYLVFVNIETVADFYKNVLNLSGETQFCY